MRIMVLAGKKVDEDRVRELLGNVEFGMARYDSVSRGVRRLDQTRADLVVLVPDGGDGSWSRALHRIREEYHTWPILLASGDADLTRATRDGAFDAFDLATVTPGQLARSFRHLERQIALETALAKSRTMSDWIEETGRLGSWEMDSEGRTTWSDGVRRILGDQGQLTDDFTSVRQFIHPEDLEIYDQANKATFEQGWPLDFEYRVLTGDGDVRYLHLHRRVEHGPDSSVARAYGMVRDVTPEREFEHFLFRRDAILQVVGSFAERFLRESDWEGGIDSGLRELGRAADVTRVFIFNKSSAPDDKITISMVHEWAASSVMPLIDRPEVRNQPFSPTYDRWRSAMLRRKVVAGHIRNFRSEERKFYEATGAKSIMIVPVFVGKQWWGFIGFSEHRQERDWLPVEIESLTMVADMFGSAILRSSMEDQLKEANTLAQEASKAKSRFLANMSHEIRTPISGILGMAEMTITTGLTADQREHVDMIRDAARSLLSIINDVLDISKIEADKMELKPEDFEFRTVLETTVRPFTPQAERKGIVFQHTVADDVPTHVHGDPDRLGQVLRNLIGNAMKFTERGLIELAVTIDKQEEERACLRFTVRDTGEGIAPDKLDTIFESFTQADGSTHKKHQGTGLGLTISRELVEMMGGEITVESTPGRGSTFAFTVWFTVPKQRAATVKAVPAAAPRTMHLNILLAEDNPLNRKFLTHFLTMFGHTVTVVKNGVEALDELKRQGKKIDLVLMDIQMPEMGGIEATKAIRDSDGKRFDPAIPVIALTAYAMKGDKERMLRAGMDDYVSKPVDMKELSAALARCMAGRDQGPALSCSPPPSQVVRERMAAGTAAVELDMDSLIERFDGNVDLLRDILDLFLIEAEEKLAVLDAALKGEDIDQLGMALHSITNIASHVLAMDIVNLARSLERRCYHGTMDEVLEGVMELRPQFVALVQAVRGRAKTL